jgi:NTE family protein
MDVAMKTKKINMALQGGGAHGAFTWGVLDKFLEDGRIAFDGISATSAGAMNAAIIAQGIHQGGNDTARELLEKFWLKMSSYGKIFSPVHQTPADVFLNLDLTRSSSYFIFELFSHFLSPYQFNPGNFNPLKNILNEMIDFDQLRQVKCVKLFICATNVRSGRIKIFQDGDISLESLLASSALPQLFQAVQIGDDYYWDGGYLGNPAIFPLIYNTDSQDVIIVHINPIIRHNIPKDTGEILNRVNEISFNSSLLRELRVIHYMSDLLDKGWIKEEYLHQMKKMFMHSLRADKLMEQYSVASKLNPDWQFLTNLRDMGRDVAHEWLDKNYKSIGNNSTINWDEVL